MIEVGQRHRDVFTLREGAFIGPLSSAVAYIDGYGGASNFQALESGAPLEFQHIKEIIGFKVVNLNGLPVFSDYIKFLSSLTFVYQGVLTSSWPDPIITPWPPNGIVCLLNQIEIEQVYTLPFQVAKNSYGPGRYPLVACNLPVIVFLYYKPGNW